MLKADKQRKLKLKISNAYKTDTVGLILDDDIYVERFLCSKTVDAEDGIYSW